MQCFFDSRKASEEKAKNDKTFAVYYSDKKDRNQTVHIHESCEIFLCISGGKTFLIDDRLYDIEDGDLFITNQFEAHKVTVDPEKTYSRYIMHVHPTFIYSVSSENVNLSDCFYREDRANRVKLTENEKTELCSLMNGLSGDYGYGDEIYKRIKATEILLFVSRLFSTRTPGEQAENHHKTVKLAMDYINGNYQTRLSLEIIARNSYVSVNQLCRLFSKYCGTTVTKYITSKRITEAKKLLSEGKSVTDTAFMCGFNDYANFIRVFKKMVGVPPGKYRAAV